MNTNSVTIPNEAAAPRIACKEKDEYDQESDSMTAYKVKIGVLIFISTGDSSVC